MVDARLLLVVREQERLQSPVVTVARVVHQGVVVTEQQVQSPVAVVVLHVVVHPAQVQRVR